MSEYKGFIVGGCIAIAGMCVFPEGIMSIKYWLFTASLFGAIAGASWIKD